MLSSSSVFRSGCSRMYQSHIDEYDCSFYSVLKDNQGRLMYEWKMALTKEQAFKILAGMRELADDTISNNRILGD